MRSWIETHPYLLWSLVLLALLATALALCPKRLRWSALLSGLLALPFAVTFAWEAQPYWSPARVWPTYVSLEDFIFSFASAGLTWLVATWPLHRRVRLHIRARRLLLQ